MIRIALLLIVVLGVTGCTETPLPALPPGDVPAAFAEPVANNAPIWPASDWWKGYGDPQLSALIEKAQTGNLDLAQAEARLRQADARARQAGAALLPTLGLNGTVNNLYGHANGNVSSVRDRLQCRAGCEL